MRLNIVLIALILNAPTSPCVLAGVRVGGDRPVDVHVPLSYDPAVPMPLVLLLHGYTFDGLVQESYMRFRPLADSRGFLFAHPDGTTDLQGQRFWNATDACCNFNFLPVDDSSYLRQLIGEVRGLFNVHPNRIYLVGHSNGGFMSYRMACDHADLIAAIASLAGATFIDPDDCTPSEPVHVLQIHGTLDTVITYDGNILPAPYPGAIATVEQWADYNDCSPNVESSPTPLDLDLATAGAETRVSRYRTGCSASGSAELWSIDSGGHVPQLTPDGSSTSFATNVVDWLLSHPKESAPTSGSQLPGDANQDGLLDILDPVHTLFLLLPNAGSRLPCDGASLAEGGNREFLDTNDDMRVDMSDVVHALTFLFQNGPPHSLGTQCVVIEGCPPACPK